MIPMMMCLNEGLNLKWFEQEIEMAPENEIQKNWTEPIFDTEVADLILQLEPKDVKRFNAFQDRSSSQ